MTPPMGYSGSPVIAIRRLTILLLLLAALGCNRSQAEAPKAAPAESRPIAVTTAKAETRQRTVETSGSLLAWEEVQAKSEQPGTVGRLHVDLGDRVQAGAVLAEYDRREFQLAVDQARAYNGARVTVSTTR